MDGPGRREIRYVDVGAQYAEDSRKPVQRPAQGNTNANPGADPS